MDTTVLSSDNSLTYFLAIEYLVFIVFIISISGFVVAEIKQRRKINEIYNQYKGRKK